MVKATKLRYRILIVLTKSMYVPVHVKGPRLAFQIQNAQMIVSGQWTLSVTNQEGKGEMSSQAELLADVERYNEQCLDLSSRVEAAETREADLATGLAEVEQALKDAQAALANEQEASRRIASESCAQELTLRCHLKNFNSQAEL